MREEKADLEDGRLGSLSIRLGSCDGCLSGRSKSCLGACSHAFEQWKELGLLAVRSRYSYSITNGRRYIAFFAACVLILVATGSVLIMHHPAKSPAIAVT